MKTKKKTWIIGGSIAAILLAAIVCAQCIVQMQRPMCIELLGEGNIRHVEASCFSPQGWQRETLTQDELQQLVHLMNRIWYEQTTPPSFGPVCKNRMIFTVEKSNGTRSHMVLADRTLTVNNDNVYLLSYRDARQINRLLGKKD